MLFAVIVEGLVDLTSAPGKRASDANIHTQQCETVSHSSGTVRRSIGPVAVFWERPRMHWRTAPGSRLRGQTDVNTA